MMATYKVDVTRDKGWWIVKAHVPRAIVWTQARRLDQVEALVRDAIASALNVRADSFEIETSVNLAGDIKRQINGAKAAARRAEIAAAEHARRNRQVARALKAHGFTVRDAGALMGVSPQRAQQLQADAS